MTDLTIGQQAPNFELPISASDNLRLADYRGKFVVLYFYPKDDTSGCTTEGIDFTARRAAFEKAGAVVIGISPDSCKSHDRFKAKHSLDVILVADEERKAIEAYGVWREKSMYGRKYMGVERTTYLIDRDGKIARIWTKVKVAGHAEEVLEAVKASA